MTSIKGRHRLLAVTVGLILLTARPASAGSWWLTWLDELSGPGPYRGPIISIDVWCFGTRTLTPAEISTEQGGDSTKNILVKPAFCTADRSNTIFGLQLEMGFWNDNPGTRYVGDTSLKSYQVIAYFPLHRIFSTEVNRATRAIEVGAGLGLYQLTGDTVVEPEWWRGSVPIRVRVMPSEFFYSKSSTKNPQVRRALQGIQFRAGWDFLPGVISSEAFRGLPPNQVSNEFIKTYGVQFDVGSLFWAVAKKN
jgi:hypothetical protein